MRELLEVKRRAIEITMWVINSLTVESNRRDMDSSQLEELYNTYNRDCMYM